jgi:hypothetical protein
MKSIKIGLTAIILTASILFASSCKKDPAPAPTTQEKILGKWKIQRISDNDFYSGLPHITTYTGNASDYADFRKDGKVEISLYGSADTSPYGIISESKIWIYDAADIYDVKELTGTALKLYQKEIYSGMSEYAETTYIFSR